MRKLQCLCKEKVNWFVILGIYVLQIVVFQVMVHVTFPVIQENLGTLKMFDMTKGGYDTTTAVSILESLGTAGRDMYLHVQMPIDFLYPCIMAAVYFLVLVKTSSSFRYSYYIFPILLVLLDWTENICIILMLTGHEITDRLVGISSFCTQAKAIVGDYILYFAAILGLLVCFIRWIQRKVRKSTKD